MNKGFVLTFDATLAVLTTIIMSSVLINMLSSGSANYFDKQRIIHLGNDMLSLLEQDGTFKNYTGKSETEVNSDLLKQLQLLPEYYCANISVRIYDVKTESFEKTYTAKSCEEDKELVVVKRIFADYTEQKFGIAEIGLWLK